MPPPPKQWREVEAAAAAVRAPVDADPPKQSCAHTRAPRNSGAGLLQRFCLTFVSLPFSRPSGHC